MMCPAPLPTTVYNSIDDIPLTQFLYEEATLEDYTDVLANYLPKGKLFDSAYISGTNLRAFLKSFAGLSLRVISLLNQISREHDIRQSTLWLDRWERALGIPKFCSGVFGDLTFRRQRILAQLAVRGARTKEQFETFLEVLGYEAEIIDYVTYATFPYTFPITLISTPNTMFTVVVRAKNRPVIAQFPLGFPIPFGNTGNKVFECIVRRLIPAHVKVIHIYYD